MDLKHLQDKYKIISNDYSKYLIETQKKDIIINEIIKEHTYIIKDVRKQMIKLKNELSLLKNISAENTPVIKSIEMSNSQIPKLKCLAGKSCVF
jgi:hypothetical protein